MKQVSPWTSVYSIVSILLLTAVSLFMPCPAQAAVMTEFGRLAPVVNQAGKPTAVATDSSGKVYVVESLSNKVNVFSQGGNLLGSIMNLDKPSSIAVDSAGRIYVGSAWKGNVTVFDSSYNELFKLGAGDGEFGSPADIQIDANDTIYVVDEQNNAIRTYNAGNPSVGTTLIGTPGSANGQLHHPASLAIDAVGQELIVLDRQQINDMYGAKIDGARIQFFSMTGQFLRGYSKFGYNLEQGQLPRPVQVAVDGQSRVYVSDARHQKVLVYDNTNHILGVINDISSPFLIPLGLTISKNNVLYVASMRAKQVEAYGLDGFSAFTAIPNGLGFNATEGGNSPPAQGLTVNNIGTNQLDWIASASEPWITLAQATGTVAGASAATIDVMVNSDGFAPGEYTGSINLVTGTGITEQIQVTLTQSPNPMVVSPGSLTFTSEVGKTPDSAAMSVTNIGQGTLTWNAVADQGWIVLSATTGTAPSNPTVNIDVSQLAVGTYNGTITFTRDGGDPCPIQVPVSLTLTESTSPELDVPPLPVAGGPGVTAGGKYWSVSQVLPGTDLYGVWGSARKDLFVVGASGAILTNKGKDWSVMASGTTSRLNSVWGSSASDVYAVSADGLVQHYDGKKWTTIFTSGDEIFQDVHGGSDSGMTIVGSDGTILDESFADLSNGEVLMLRSVWGTSASDVYVVGQAGAVRHYDGQQWTAVDSGTDRMLNSAWGSSETDVFAVGESGAIVHYDGDTWSAMESGTLESLLGVWGSAADDVYAVGANAVVLHYDGASWQTIIAGSEINLNDVWVSDKSVVYAVGDDGTILEGKNKKFPWSIILQNINQIGVQARDKEEKTDQERKTQQLLKKSNQLK